MKARYDLKTKNLYLPNNTHAAQLFMEHFANYKIHNIRFRKLDASMGAEIYNEAGEPVDDSIMIDAKNYINANL